MMPPPDLSLPPNHGRATLRVKPNGFLPGPETTDAAITDLKPIERLPRPETTGEGVDETEDLVAGQNMRASLSL